MATPLADGYLKWSINGLGEAYGFWFKLKASGQPFIVKTLHQVDRLAPTEKIEWLIDAGDLNAALKVFEGLELDPWAITWKKPS